MAFINSVPLSRSSLTPRFISPLRPSCRSFFSLPRRVSSAPIVLSLSPPTSAFSSSSNPDTLTAISDLLPSLLSQIPSPTVLFLACPLTHSPAILHSHLRTQLPSTRIHGITTCSSPLTPSGPSPSLLALALSSGFPSSGSDSSEPSTAAQEAVSRLLSRTTSPLSAILMHASPGFEEATLSEIARVIGPDVQVWGGTAADDTVSGEWKVWSGDAGPSGSGVSLIGVEEGNKVGLSMVVPYEEPEFSGIVNKAQGRCVMEIDGKMAAEVVAGWMGGEVERKWKEEKGGEVIVESSTRPLGVNRNGGWVGRHVSGLREDGGVEMFGEVKEGERIGLMGVKNGSVQAGKNGLKEARKRAMGDIGGKGSGGMFVVCGGVGIAVGEDLGKVCEGMEEAEGMVGMTVFGEQGKVGTGNEHSNLAVGVALFA